MDNKTPEARQLKKTEPYAITSFVLLLACLPLSIFTVIISGGSVIFGIMLELSIAFGVLALVKIKSNPELKGITVSVFSIILSTVFLALLFFAAFSNNNSRDSRFNFQEPDPSPATISEPLTLSRETVSTVREQSVILKASIYNVFNETTSFSLNTVCNDKSVIIKQSSDSTKYIINPGESKIVNLSLSFNIGEAPTNSYLCTVTTITSSSNDNPVYSKDFGLQIN